MRRTDRLKLTIPQIEEYMKKIHFAHIAKKYQRGRIVSQGAIWNLGGESTLTIETTHESEEPNANPNT